MARIKNMKTIDLKIAENEEKLRKLKERCDNISAELDQLYEEKKGTGKSGIITSHNEQFKNEGGNFSIFRKQVTKETQRCQITYDGVEQENLGKLAINYFLTLSTYKINLVIS